MDNKFKLIYRLDWEAAPPRGPMEKMNLPVDYIAVSYVIADSQLTSEEAMRHLQRRDFFRGMTDIQSNFYIAGDGKVFEGRGWRVAPGSKNEFPGKEGKFLEFTYIGDYSNEDMNHPAYISTGALLEIGFRSKYITKTATFLTDETLIRQVTNVQKKILALPSKNADAGESSS